MQIYEPYVSLCRGFVSICCIFECTDAKHTSGEDISAMAAHKASSCLSLHVKQQKTWGISDKIWSQSKVALFIYLLGWFYFLATEIFYIPISNYLLIFYSSSVIILLNLNQYSFLLFSCVFATAALPVTLLFPSSLLSWLKTFTARVKKIMEVVDYMEHLHGCSKLMCGTVL